MKRQAILILVIVSSLFFTGIVSADQETGNIFVWGANDFGQRTHIPAGDDFTAVAAGRYHTVALRENGTIVAWGDNDYDQCNVPAGNDFIAIDAGGMNSIALRQNGSIVVWGDNEDGQYNVPAGNDFMAIAVGGSGFCLALKNNGTIVAWGDNEYGQCNAPAGNDYVAIRSGDAFSLALRENGSIAAWGLNQFGECKVPAGNDFPAISAGWSTALAVRTNGTAIGWGMNNVKQCDPPSGNNYRSVVAGDQFSCALRENGSIVTWGETWYNLNQSPAGDGYFALDAGQYHAVTLHSPVQVNASVSGGHGTSEPPSQTVKYMSDVNISFFPDPGYRIASITDNGVENAIENPYSITDIQTDHQIVVAFAIASGSGAPIAGFSATPKSGISPLQVQFNDTSTGKPPLSYQWNFGDGTPNVTVQNPVHTYTTGSNRTFTAVLTVANSEGTNSTSCDIQVNVTSMDPSGIRWNITTVDPNAGKETSIGVDAAGHPQICYIDPVRGALLYALYNGAGWHIETVDDSVPGDQSTSLAIDTAGDPHIAYTDMERGYIKYATQWDHTNVEQVSPECISLALNSAGEAYIAYGVTSDSDINHPPGLFWVTNHGGGWNTFEIDSTANPTWCSIAVDSKRNGFHIGYYDANNIPDPYNIGVKYAWADSGGWHSTMVDPTGLNWYGSLAINSRGGPSMAYSNGNGDLAYAWFDGHYWYRTIVDKGSMFVSLAIDAKDNPHIAYSDAGGTLKYAWSDANGWHTTTVDSAAFPGVGYFCSLAIDAAGHPHISYWDMSHNALKYAYGTIGEPKPPEDFALELAAGWNFISVPKRLASDADTVGEVLLRHVDTANHPIWLYDASEPAWEVMREDDVLKPLDGIWVYSAINTSVPLVFDKDPLHLPSTKSLYTGWNAIGFSDIQPLSAKSTLLSVKNAWTILNPFDAAVQRYDTSIINGGTGVHSDEREMKPGDGYWLYMTDAGTLPAIGA